MSLATAIAAIRQRLDAVWVATLLVHESRSHTPAADQAFLLCEIAPSPAAFASIGAPDARLVRRPGSILIHVHVPLSEADPAAAAQAHATSVAGIYEGAEFSGVVCRAATVGAGAESGGAFWRVTVTIPFVFDEIV
jgi:hypothetical protein